jgi:glycerol-3-phosphate dehydrogenase
MGQIQAANCVDPVQHTGAIRARQFVNAAGAWSMAVARLAGCQDVHLLYAKGTLLVTTDRLARMWSIACGRPATVTFWCRAARCRCWAPPRRGWTTWSVSAPTVDEVDRNIREGAAMIPALQHARYIRALQPGAPAVAGW